MDKEGLRLISCILMAFAALAIILRFLLGEVFLPESVSITRGTVSDFNGDRASDVVVENEHSEFEVFGSGGLEGPVWETVEKSTVHLVFPEVIRGIPVIGDFDGDSLADLGLFDSGFTPSVDRAFNWQIWITDPGAIPFGKFQMGLPKRLTFSWGNESSLAVPADYNGDGITDLGVFDRQTGLWNVAYLGVGQNFAQALLGNEPYGLGVQWGLPGDIPLASDFSGDGKADFVVVRKDGEGLRWYILQNGSQARTDFVFGKSGDTPFAGDVSGSGSSSALVFRSLPELSYWFVPSAKGEEVLFQCEARVVPFLGDFDGDGRMDVACFVSGEKSHWTARLSRIAAQARRAFSDKGPIIWQGSMNGGGMPVMALLSEHQRGIR